MDVSATISQGYLTMTINGRSVSISLSQRSLDMAISMPSGASVSTNAVLIEDSTGLLIEDGTNILLG